MVAPDEPEGIKCITTHHLENMNVCTIFYSNLSRDC